MLRFVASFRTALVRRASHPSRLALPSDPRLPYHLRFRPLSSTASSKPLSILTRIQRLVSSATQSLNASATPSDDPERKLQLSRLLSLARPEKRLVGFALSAQLVSASSIMLFPLALGKVVDTVTGTGPTDLNSLVLIMGGVFSVSAIASATRVAAMSLAGSRISRQLRVSLFHSILRQETAFFDKRQSGELINRLSSDVPLVSRTLTENLAKILRNAVTSASSMSLILYLSPKLSLVTICSIPPIVGFALIFGRTARRLSRELVDALAAATQIAAERTGAIRTVRTFGAEEEESNRYTKRVDETYNLAKKVAIADGLYSGSVQLSAQMSLLGVLWFGGRMVTNPADPMTIGALTSFAMYAVNLGVSISAMGTSYGQLTRALGAGHRIFEVLDRDPEGYSSTIADKTVSSQSTSRTSDMETETSMLTLQPGYDATVRFNNVHFHYPTQPKASILRGVDLEVRPGEIVAIAGGSGSGKSTIGALLSRLYDPTEGRISIGGTSIADIDTGWLRSQIAVVSQEPILFDGTVAENIRYAMTGNVSLEVVQNAARAAASHEMIMALPRQYETKVGERGSALSGGQRARTALCRALVREPRVLVLDEHSAALDAESERAVGQAVHNAATDLNMAVVTIAHRTSSLRRANRVAVLVDGKVAELDSYVNLMRKPQSHLRRMLVADVSAVYQDRG
ncbi:ATP-binding cassette sub-family B member 10, mitochondrial [Gracilariopsis chorda]|uniref:Probable ATP-dependent transporter ycf16 n=1 Tax=Gracilariopsis chorda TaxID=448386 RepID=A0A2V3J6S9_9FLOR|nr:ATP-binding cassette sub-family B member 10, mitochondrial [Gracilariopsis chorda]|eukprot:PXF49842.1 ATP-binding cassette sub-family B member 10, mitochondrial [Gracilariopsis chorda]